MPNPYAPEWTTTLHPDVIELGLKYASGEIHGDNARCRAMLAVFSAVLRDYHPPTTTTAGDGAGRFDYRTHLDHQVLKPSFQFWTAECRPHSVSMGNAFTFLKAAVSSLGRDVPFPEAKVVLQETIDQYVLERLDYAARAIAQHALTKLRDGDVVLTFGHSEVVSLLLTTAHRRGIDLYVWVVDARPLWEGKKLLHELQSAGVPSGYIQLNALTYVMRNVTKVFLGCTSLLSNGSVYGRAGTACVALSAKDHHVPVLVCCQTYKISNKVQLESITHNELGDPDALLRTDGRRGGGGGSASSSSPLADWRDVPNLKLLNLLYDVTPSEFLSGIVTELGIVPPTSVAVLIREMNPQDAAYL
jgi:translation initiation factor eIF-2B subunit delta